MRTHLFEATIQPPLASELTQDKAQTWKYLVLREGSRGGSHPKAPAVMPTQWDRLGQWDRLARLPVAVRLLLTCPESRIFCHILTVPDFKTRVLKAAAPRQEIPCILSLLGPYPPTGFLKGDS